MFIKWQKARRTFLLIATKPAVFSEISLNFRLFQNFLVAVLPGFLQLCSRSSQPTSLYSPTAATIQFCGRPRGTRAPGLCNHTLGNHSDWPQACPLLMVSWPKTIFLFNFVIISIFLKQYQEVFVTS